MEPETTVFAIPTYRLRDMAEAIEAYDADFRTGTNDIDALDYVSMFLDNAHQTDPPELNDRYVLVNFRPVAMRQRLPP